MVCGITNKYLCHDCMIKHEGHWISRELLDYYLRYNWTQVKLLPPEKEREVERVKVIKEELWKNETPLIIQESFKINIENDHIEPYVAVYCRQQDFERVNSSLSFLQ